MNFSFFRKKPNIEIDLKDKDGKRVVWYKESYDSHIKLKHVDVKTCQDKLKKALTEPQLKKIDERRKSVIYYYEIRKDKQGKPLYIKVVVDYNRNPAFIRTAFLTTNIEGASIVY